MIHILLVDDDPDILEILQLDLEDDSDFAVKACRSSIEALEEATKKQYDSIITDWRMPGMNGTELIKNLRAGGCRSCIILYSGLAMGPAIRTAMDAGADYVIHRTGDPDAEFAMLRQIIRERVPSGSGGQEK